MSKKQPIPIGDALAGYLSHAGLVKRLAQAGVVAEWPALVGPQIAAVTDPQAVTADGVLWVRVATAPWANELRLMTPRILGRLNAGRTGRIKEIRWMVAPFERRAPESQNP